MAVVVYSDTRHHFEYYMSIHACSIIERTVCISWLSASTRRCCTAGRRSGCCATRCRPQSHATRACPWRNTSVSMIVLLETTHICIFCGKQYFVHAIYIGSVCRSSNFNSKAEYAMKAWNTNRNPYQNVDIMLSFLLFIEIYGFPHYVHRWFPGRFVMSVSFNRLWNGIIISEGRI